MVTVNDANDPHGHVRAVHDESEGVDQVPLKQSKFVLEQVGFVLPRIALQEVGSRVARSLR